MNININMNMNRNDFKNYDKSNIEDKNQIKYNNNSNNSNNNSNNNNNDLNNNDMIIDNNNQNKNNYNNNQNDQLGMNKSSDNESNICSLETGTCISGIRDPGSSDQPPQCMSGVNIGKKSRGYIFFFSS